MPYQSVSDFNKICLGRHGLIEASAGTGKTFTIENLVVRFLKERADLELENILLVTFTEKATSELKTRIREKLEGELNETDNDRKTQKRLRGTLDTFDRASIYTIHGFCQTVLRDFAFENHTAFQSEVIDDAPLFETLLKDQMRKEWPHTYGSDLEKVLAVSAFEQTKASFLETIIRVARSFQERSGDRIKPDPSGRGFQDIMNDLKTSFLKLRNLVGSGKQFSCGFGKLNIHGGSKKAILNKIVIPLEAYVTAVDEETFNVVECLELILQIEAVKSAGRKGIQCLSPKWLKSGANLEVCPNLNQIVKEFQELTAISKSLRHILAVQSIYQLQKDVNQLKQKNGWISYYDMLSLVEQALSGRGSSSLLERLRGKYKVAFIDEFQDTDPVQWNIFRKIFIHTHGEIPENLLFLIGDPKQAIYSFRGADVYAYLSAKKEMERLEKAGRAKLYSLSVNWRSQPDLIACFNRLFCGEEWFKPHEQTVDFEIGYQEACFPEEAERPEVIVEDDSGRPGLNIVNLSDASSPKPAKVLLAKFIANEIQHLVAGSIRLKGKAGTERRLGFGDVSILVHSKSEVTFIEDELSKLEIPYSFYKKPGLFLSNEAYYLSLVFHSILDPGGNSEVKKALMTPFFRFDLSGLFAYEEMTPSHPVRQILLKWSQYAKSRQWGLLFQSLMENSGLVFYESRTSDWERKYTNYRQILEYLQVAAYQRNLDFRRISTLLDTYRRQSAAAEEDADIHQIETEARKVQIMTMHVSKGLQFPVVFVAGGLTQRPTSLDQYHVYHEIQEKGTSSNAIKVVDLAKSDVEGRHGREKADEYKRLYYVASTRSQYKLYLPFYRYDANHPWVGPVSRLLAPAIDNSFAEGAGGKDVLWLRHNHHSGSATEKPVSLETEKAPTISISEQSNLFPSQENYQDRRIRLESFSGLHTKRTRVTATQEKGRGFQALRETAKEDDESFASQSTLIISSEAPPDEMPGGVSAGLLFHDILEKIDFEEVATLASGNQNDARSLLMSPGTRDTILSQMETYRMDKQWEEHISMIVWKTLTTTIDRVGDDFALCQLHKRKRLHEMEFYYPFPSRVRGREKVPGCAVTKGFITGFIRGFVDLIFHHDQRFYLADWKSNYLESGYDHESMLSNMNHADYHLQYKLYAVATLRWLKQVLGDQFEPERHFGGVFYFYLRGMGKGNGDGIYHVPAHALGPLDQLEQEVALILET